MRNRYLAALARLVVWPVCAYLGSLPAGASPFYKLQVVAQTGQANSNGDALTFIDDDGSINDRGTVAFIGGIAAGESVYTVAGTGAPTIISLATPSTRDYSRGLRINNSGQVGARDASGTLSFVRYWDSASPGTFVIVAEGSTAAGAFDLVFSHPSINDSNQAVFSGTDAPGGDFLATPAAAPPGTFNKINLATPLRPMIANDGRVIVRAGSLSTSPIRVYANNLGSFVDVATEAMGFTALGRSPGISDDGMVVVFAGDRGNGAGIFMRLANGATFDPIVKIAGENGGAAVAELGFDDVGSKIFINGVTLDQRVGVARLDLGDAGLRDDTLVIAFIGTPNNASRDNPTIPGTQPLLFSNQRGLFAVRVDLDRPLSGAAGFQTHVNSPIPVAQIGDTLQTALGPRVITDITVNDPLSNAARDTTGGAIRTQRRGDHYVGFSAFAGAEQLFIRGTHLDSDQDGLLDHWEEAGGGIDIDNDGAVDLNLAALGALTGSRDLFLEIDWLTNRSSGVTTAYSNEPPPLTTASVSGMFANAPVLSGAMHGARSDGMPPADIPAGITAHIDAGAGNDMAGMAFSQNMPAQHQGGDQIAAFTGGPHLDLVYFGLPNSVAVAGVNARAFHDIKDNFFGTADKRARELAFHYTTHVDFYQMHGDRNGDGIVGPNETNNAAPFVGMVTASTSSTVTAMGTPFDIATGLGGIFVLVATGTGAGQLRGISANTASMLTVTPNWSTNPGAGASLVLFSTSSGLGEGEFRADFSSRPGNDHIVSLGGFGVNMGPMGNFLGTAFHHSQTVAHEGGHTLGLRHGGVNHNTCPLAAGLGCSAQFKGTYQSLMNYAYQFGNPQPATGLTITDYSRPGDAVFVDWQNQRLDFFSSAHHVGNTFKLTAAGAEPPFDDPAFAEMTITDTVDAFGPLDLVHPTVAIQSPADGAIVPPGGNLTVTATATDNDNVEAVMVEFDLDGDGTIEGPEELVTADAVGGDAYEATLIGIAGPEETRIVTVFAMDPVRNLGMAMVTVEVSSSAPDSDSDGVTDDGDNCTLIANADQRDTNGDGIGNLCDPDLDGNCAVNFTDLGQLKAVFFSTNADADFDGNGSVTFGDLGIMKAVFFGQPGPSAAGCN